MGPGLESGSRASCRKEPTPTSRAAAPRVTDQQNPAQPVTDLPEDSSPTPGSPQPLTPGPHHPVGLSEHSFLHLTAVNLVWSLSWSCLGWGLPSIQIHVGSRAHSIPRPLLRACRRKGLFFPAKRWNFPDRDRIHAPAVEAQNLNTGPPGKSRKSLSKTWTTLFPFHKETSGKPMFDSSHPPGKLFLLLARSADPSSFSPCCGYQEAQAHIT